MVALQIRGVSDHVRDVLAERAASRGQSLQGYLLALVNEDADRPSNADLLRRFEGRTDGTHLAPGESAKLIEQARAERDARFL